MIKLRWLFRVLLGLAAWPMGNACAVQDALPLPCAQQDRACLTAALQKHTVRRHAFWQSWQTRPLDERMGRAPAELVQYLTLDNLLSGFPERPRGVDAEPALLRDVQMAVRELPTSVQRLLKDRLLGIAFVEGLGGTGFTDVAFGSSGEPVGGFMVLDLGLLRHHTANSWASWKENTPFKWDRAMRLHAQLQYPEHDNRKNAIQYILLHELGHVVAINRAVHPPWWEAPPSDVPPERYPFFALSWQRKLDSSHRYASLFDADFPQRSRVVYYLQPRLRAEDMQAVYEQLEQTNFTSLYGATGPADDFAEAFASYVHVVLMQKPWQITLQREGQAVKVFGHCWDAQRCASKRALLDALLR